jgi:hypothetical protein
MDPFAIIGVVLLLMSLTALAGVILIIGLLLRGLWIFMGVRRWTKTKYTLR